MAQLFGRTKATITWYDPQPSSTAFVLTSKRIQCTRAWYAKPTSILGQARQAASKAAAGKIARPTFYDTVVLVRSCKSWRTSGTEVPRRLKVRPTWGRIHPSRYANCCNEVLGRPVQP